MCDIVHYITLAFHKYELNNSYTFRDIKHLRKINKILKNWQKSEKNREKWKNQRVFLNGEKKKSQHDMSIFETSKHHFFIFFLLRAHNARRYLSKTALPKILVIFDDFR